MLAHDQLVAGSRDVMVSGGMESMTNAPHLLLKGRSGIRIGHDRIFDHMMLDGLEDALLDPAAPWAPSASSAPTKYRFTREAGRLRHSVQRAKAATESGAFKAEITPVTVKGRAGETVISIDEGPGKVKLDKIPTLKPRLQERRHHHRSLQLLHQRRRRRPGAGPRIDGQGTGRQPIARIVGHATFSQEPEWFTTAPVGAPTSCSRKSAGA